MTDIENQHPTTKHMAQFQTPSSYRGGLRRQLHQLVRAHFAVIPRGESVRSHHGAVRDLSGDSHADRARSVHLSGHVARQGEEFRVGTQKEFA